MIIGKIALAGNPNVGKSTVFNALTGMKQHTGNWSGKTVGTAEGTIEKGRKEIKLVDLPGTYSLSVDSAEEEVTRNFLCFEKFDGAVVLCDACCLERNLIFALQVAQLVPKTILCVNMLDDARKKGIEIDIHALSEETGLPAIGISAANLEGIDKLKNMMFELAEGKLSANLKPLRYPENIKKLIAEVKPILENEFGIKGIYPAFEILKNGREFVSEFERHFGKISKNKKLSDFLLKSDVPADFSDKISACTVLRAEEICLSSVKFSLKKSYSKDEKIDSVLTGKLLGTPIMLLLFGFIFWITVSGANYPSEILSAVFSRIGIWLEQVFSALNFNPVLKSLLLDGIWNVLSWVVAVMLPPMAIFFPLFTILEDIGYLPRVAFNLDRGFRSAGACGKQALTMWLVYKRIFSHIFLRRCFLMEYSAALYMRLSKEDGKKDFGSIGSQKELLRHFAAEKGFSVFGEYIDEGFSGTNFERPAFKRMISDIEGGKINLVITKDLSRLGRDYISAGEFTEIYFPSKGVRYISVADCYDSENSFGDIIPFKNVFNEMYARDISRKIRFAFSARMKNGDFVGAFAPFGYKRSAENRHKLVIDENTAYLVKRIFSESAEGKRPIEIAKGLDSENVPTPLDFRKGISKSRNWSSATILKILKNPVYLGHLEQGKTSKISFKSKKSLDIPKENRFFVKSTHEAIIDEKTFEKANRKYRKK